MRDPADGDAHDYFGGCVADLFMTPSSKPGDERPSAVILDFNAALEKRRARRGRDDDPPPAA